MRYRSLDPRSYKRKHQLQQTHKDHRRHADIPRHHRGVSGRHALRLQSNKCGAEHSQGKADSGGRVETERHRRDSRVAGALGEPESQPGVDRVADKHTEGGTREHSCINNVCRELKAQSQNAGEKRKNREVVEREPKETVNVSHDEPFVTGGA